MRADRPRPARQRGGVESVMRLGAFNAFAQLAPGRLAGLAELTEERFFRQGDVVQRAGTPAREIHYLIDGEVEIRPSGGPPERLGHLSVINGLAAFARVIQSDEVVAVADTTTLSFTQEDQEDVFEEHGDILARVIHEVAGTYLDTRRASGWEGSATLSAREGRPTTHAMGLVGKMTALRATAPFDEAPLEALAELARESPEVHYRAGERLWQAGHEGGWSVAIVSGRLLGSIDRGREQLRFRAGSMPGALDILAARPRWFDATADSDVTGIRIDGDALFDVLDDHTEMAFGLLRSMARGILALRDGRAGSGEPMR